MCRAAAPAYVRIGEGETFYGTKTPTEGESHPEGRDHRSSQSDRNSAQVIFAVFAGRQAPPRTGECRT